MTERLRFRRINEKQKDPLFEPQPRKTLGHRHRVTDKTLVMYGVLNMVLQPNVSSKINIK